MRWFFALTSLGLILCVVGVFLLMRPDAKGSRPATSPFFSDNQVLLRQVPGAGPAPKFGGTPIYDACSVITIDGLTRLGVELNHDVTVMHDYLEGDVPPDAAVSQPGLDSASHCYYGLSNRNWLQVFVYQTPYNSAHDLEFSIGKAERKGAEIRTEDDLSVAELDLGDMVEIRLWKAGLLVVVTFQTERPGPYGPFDKATFAAKLEQIAKAAVLRGPTAPMRHVYTSLFDKVKHPCEIASTEAFMKAFPSHSAAAVKTQFHPRAASTPMERHKTESALQGGMSCTRHNIVADGVTNDAEYRELGLSLNMWDNQQAATDLNAYQCDPADHHPFGTPVAVTPVAGTGQTCLTELVLDWVLEMQIDNVNISLQAALAKPKPPAGQRRDELMPAAQAIATAGVSR